MHHLHLHLHLHMYLHLHLHLHLQARDVRHLPYGQQLELLMAAAPNTSKESMAQVPV